MRFIHSLQVYNVWKVVFFYYVPQDITIDDEISFGFKVPA